MPEFDMEEFEKRLKEGYEHHIVEKEWWEIVTIWEKGESPKDNAYVYVVCLENKKELMNEEEDLPDYESWYVTSWELAEDFWNNYLIRYWDVTPKYELWDVVSYETYKGRILTKIVAIVDKKSHIEYTLADGHYAGEWDLSK